MWGRISEQLQVFGRKSTQAERIACPKLLKPEGLLKKSKEGRCDFGRGRSGDTKLGVSWGHLMKDLVG